MIPNEEKVKKYKIKLEGKTPGELRERLGKGGLIGWKKNLIENKLKEIKEGTEKEWTEKHLEKID
jgi:hypothetical protein